jgi:hypothetical protein
VRGIISPPPLSSPLKGEESIKWLIPPQGGGIKKDIETKKYSYQFLVYSLKR